MTSEGEERDELSLTSIILDRILSVSVVILIVSSILSLFVPEFGMLAGLCVLVAAAAGVFRVSMMQRAISLTLIAVGAVSLLIAVALGGTVTIERLLSVNQVLVAMIAGVSFLQLIAAKAPTVEPVAGVRSVWRTGLTLQLLGSVINVSAVNIIGDHLARRGRLELRDALLISRSFSPGAYWSPFWAAAAAALSFAPGANLPVLLLCGLLMAALAFTTGISSLVRRQREEFATFTGYPFSVDMMRVPILLVTAVITGHIVWPEIAVPAIVMIASLLLTFGVLVLARPRTMARETRRHIVGALPRNRGEITLFGAAGVLSVGLAALFEAADITLQIDEFTALTAWLAALVMTAATLLGVHPVISIAAFAAVLGTVTEPTLFALAGMIAWALQAACGPLSGLNVYLNGRWGVNNFTLARLNMPYLVIGLSAALPVLWLAEVLSNLWS
jgi:hypothetical protein